MRQLIQRLSFARAELAKTFWFIPASMTAAAAILAILVTRYESSIDPEFDRFSPWLFRGDADAAATVLGVIAGSLITVAGITFAGTIVACVLASTQFSPRVLRRFLRDEINQIALGGFIATFTYCLLVLRSTESNEDSVPEVAVQVGVLMALGSLALFILFIQHITQQLQVANVVRAITRETVAEVKARYPTAPQERVDSVETAGHNASAVRSVDFGYVQSIETDSIVQAAEAADALIALTTEPGDFVTVSSRVAAVVPPQALSPELEATIRGSIVLGSSPSLAGDVEFGIRQIADIGIKALAAGINDPTTATTCIDHLGVILSCAITRYEPERLHRDGLGQPRVISQGPAMGHMMHLSFDQIRHYGRGDRRVLTRILAVLQNLSDLTADTSRSGTIRDIAEQVARAAERGLEDDDERRAVLGLAHTILASDGPRQPVA